MLEDVVVLCGLAFLLPLNPLKGDFTKLGNMRQPKPPSGDLGAEYNLGENLNA